MILKHGLAAVLALLLTGCIGISTTVEPPPIAATSASPSPAAPPTNPPATDPPPTRPATSVPPTRLPGTNAPTRNPATLSPVTRETATNEAPRPPRATPTSPSPPSPTVDLGKLPPRGGTPGAEPTAEPGWKLYENTTYGFAFSYPADHWLVIERPNDPHGLALAYHEMGIALRMRFARANEEANLQLYGGAVGDFVAQGTVRFMGEDVERSALVFQGVASRIFYNGTKPIARGDMLYSFALVGLEDQTAAEPLPEGVQMEADRIIESFVRND